MKQSQLKATLTKLSTNILPDTTYLGIKNNLQGMIKDKIRLKRQIKHQNRTK